MLTALANLLERLKSGAPGFESLLAREAGWLVTAKAVQGLCSLGATLAVARYLGPAPFGELSLAIAAVALVAAVATLGLEFIASRELATGDAAVLRLVLRLRVLGAAFGCALLLAAALWASKSSHAVGPLLLVMCLVPLVQVGDVGEWRLIAEGRSRVVAMVTLAAAPTAAVLRLLLVLAGAGLVAFAWAVVAEWALRSLLLAACARGGGKAEPATADRGSRAALGLLAESAPLLLAGIAVFIYMRIDQFMIAAMLGNTRLGLYSAVVTIAEAPLVLPAILIRAALPMVARAHEQVPGSGDALLERLMRWCFWFHLLLALVLAALAEPAVRLLYGEAYVPATDAFRLVVLGGPFVAFGVMSSAWLVVHRRTGHALRRTLMGMATNIALNLVLIPTMGIAGAALATLLAQVVATYAADALFAETRALFKLKTRALRPWGRQRPEA